MQEEVKDPVLLVQAMFQWGGQNLAMAAMYGGMIVAGNTIKINVKGDLTVCMITIVHIAVGGTMGTIIVGSEARSPREPHQEALQWTSHEQQEQRQEDTRTRNEHFVDAWLSVLIVADGRILAMCKYHS